MQTRPYPTKDGKRIWLSRAEQKRLLDHLEDDPRKRIAMHLGLHGLRTDEILSVQSRHLRELSNGAEGHVLVIPDGKSGKRELPVSADLQQRIQMLKSAARLRADENLVDVDPRTVRKWINRANVCLADAHEDADQLGMHDLRRTWATDTYYSLALGGVPIAEQLTMSWGGWKQTSTGRETFRQNYLGPVPDHVTADAIQHVALA